MKYYAVIDTNVVVSAMLKWNSAPGSVVELAVTGTIVPLLNSEIVAEYRAVLSRPKFGLTADIVEDFIGALEKNGIYAEPNATNVDMPDPKDRVFYEVVMGECQREDAYLVTGNIKHFPEKPFVVTPRQMLNIIISDLGMGSRMQETAIDFEV